MLTMPRMTKLNRPAIVLLSGGLDSTTCLALAKADGHAPLYTMAFDYDQRHRHELAAAEAIAKKADVAEHRVVKIDLRQFGSRALTADIAVPKDRDEAKMNADIPITYVPARNSIFLSYALAWAEVLDVRDVFIGVNAVDYSGYPDCRPAFIESFQQTGGVWARQLNQLQRAWPPPLHLTKAQIIRRGVELGVDYSVTHSCYDPDAQQRPRAGDAIAVCCVRKVSPRRVSLIRPSIQFDCV